jgi:hypothetical protein
VCVPAGHCFGFDPRHECLAADAGANASSFCPSPDGFEEFCNVGTIPDHNDSVLFADASGTPPQYASAVQPNAGVTVVAGDFIAVNSFEFREMRGFVEMPQNVHADTLGLYKLVAIVCIYVWHLCFGVCDACVCNVLQVAQGLKQRSFMGHCSVFHIRHPSWTNKHEVARLISSRLYVAKADASNQAIAVFLRSRQRPNRPPFCASV